MYNRPVNSQDLSEMAKLDKFYIGNTSKVIVGLNEGWIHTEKAPVHFIETSVLSGAVLTENTYISKV